MGLLWVCYGSEGSAVGLKKNTLFNPLKIHYHLFLLFILIGENRVLMDKIGVKNRIKSVFRTPPVSSKLPTAKAIVLTSLTS